MFFAPLAGARADPDVANPDRMAPRSLGVQLFQGFLFAEPAFEALPAVAFGD